jgi:hypothetical protein
MTSKGLTPLPIPSSQLDARASKFPALAALPTPVSGNQTTAFPPLAQLPPCPGEATQDSLDFQPFWRSPVLSNFPDSTPRGGQSPSSPTLMPDEIVQSNPAGFTDADLFEAFGPVLEHAMHNTLFPKENQIDTYLEPMLRATIRRALAESTPGSRPFHAPGTMDRMIWHLQALFTSRTYEEIIFEKTHRFQVGEVFLVDAKSLALVSFASCDPARHASPRRVESSVQRLAMQLRDDSGKLRDSFELPDQRNVIARAGRYVTLLAVVRGHPTELVISDLEFALRRIEDRFHEQFQQQGSELLHTLQPFLEDCLLIQAPASAA